MDEPCGFCTKNPCPGVKECFESGLDTAPVRLECLERLWRVTGDRGGEGSFSPSHQNQRVMPQGWDAPNPLSASQQGQPGAGTQHSTAWPAALLSGTRSTPGWELHKENPENPSYKQELLPRTCLSPTPPPSTSCVAVPHAGNCFNQRRKTLRTQDSNPPGKVTDSPTLQRGSLNIKNSIVVLVTLI